LLLATCVGFCIRTNKRHQQHNQRHLLPECANNQTEWHAVAAIDRYLLSGGAHSSKPAAAVFAIVVCVCRSICMKKSRYCIEMTGRIKLAFGMGAFLPTMLKEIRVSPK